MLFLGHLGPFWALCAMFWSADRPQEKKTVKNPKLKKFEQKKGTACDGPGYSLARAWDPVTAVLK